MPNGENSNWWASAAEAVIRGAMGIKLGPGVLGMIAPVNIAGLVAVAVLAIFLRGEPILAVAALALIVLLIIYLNERAYRYATKNPLPALLGGGQLLYMKRGPGGVFSRDLPFSRRVLCVLSYGAKSVHRPEPDGD